MSGVNGVKIILTVETNWIQHNDKPSEKPLIALFEA